MEFEFEIKSKIVNGEVRLMVEDRKDDPVSQARYNKEDIERQKRINQQFAYIDKCEVVDKSKLAFKYKG